MRLGAGNALAALCGVAVLLLAGCTDDDAINDPLQIVENPVRATPVESPEQIEDLPGVLLPVDGEVTAVTIEPDSRTLAAAVTNGDDVAVELYDLDDLEAAPERAVMSGPVERLSAVDGQIIATIPGEDEIAYLSAAGDVVGVSEIEGGPVSVAIYGERKLVALRESKAIDVLEFEQPAATITGEIASADHVLVIGPYGVVLDRLRSAVFRFDVPDGEIDLGLRAGDGATNAVADGFERVLVTDTRASNLLAFSVDPFLLRQRFPVPGGAYGIAYDARRDLAWVTLTERNEVVGFDVAGEEPKEIGRFPVVRQADSVTVDEQTGSVAVGSAAGEGIQVIEP